MQAKKESVKKGLFLVRNNETQLRFTVIEGGKTGDVLLGQIGSDFSRLKRCCGELERSSMPRPNRSENSGTNLWTLVV
jgi:hypothetical protein